MNSEFKKISSVLLLTFTFLFGVSEAFAAEKISTKSEVIQQEIEDPDLKLSIEELRKKYPIGWLERKYGNFTYCKDMGNGFSYVGSENTPPKKLLCSFSENGFLSKEMSFKDFSNKEIKSVFVAKENTDYREIEVVRIVFRYLRDNKNKLTKNEEDLDKFIHSEKIITPFLEDDEFTL